MAGGSWVKNNASAPNNYAYRSLLYSKFFNSFLNLVPGRYNIEALLMFLLLTSLAVSLEVPFTLI
jgi:hypothetical protein